MTLLPSALPDIESLRRRCRALAMLDAILCPEWEYRYYSFNSRWGNGEEMASLRNGQGDEWFILFDAAGAAIKGLDHECLLAQSSDFIQDIRHAVPSAFTAFLNEPAFGLDQASFCYWRGADDNIWHKVEPSDAQLKTADDGSNWMMKLLVEPASGYQAFARTYFELDIDLGDIEKLYRLQPLDETIVRSLNADADMQAIQNDAGEIGYLLS